MDANPRSSLDLQSLLRLSLFRDSGAFSLGDLYGPMGDFSERAGKSENSWSSPRNSSSGESRVFNSRYRPAWEIHSDDYRDEDDFAGELAHRAILSATMNDGDDEEFGIAKTTNTSAWKPVNYQNQPRKKFVPVESLLKDKYKKSPSKLDRKIRRLKNGQDNVDDVIYMAEEVAAGSSQPPPSMPPGPTICLPLATFRRMVGAELTAEGRHMQEYYASVINGTRQEKDGALRAQIFWQDRAKKMEQESEYYADEARHLRVIADHLRAEIESLKEAKRRRRTAKKQRNRLPANHSASSGDVRELDDVDETVTSDGAQCEIASKQRAQNVTVAREVAHIDAHIHTPAGFQAQGDIGATAYSIMNTECGVKNECADSAQSKPAIDRAQCDVSSIDKAQFEEDDEIQFNVQ